MSGSLDDHVLVWDLRPPEEGDARRNADPLAEIVGQNPRSCTHVLNHEGMVYAVAVGEGYVVGATVGRVLVWEVDPSGKPPRYPDRI